MRAALAAWQNRVGDVGLIPEAEIEIQEQTAGSRFAILNRDGGKKALARLVDIATKASQGADALDDLTKGLSDSDPSVRYWSATGIGNLGMQAAASFKQVKMAMKDASPSVRIAAARAVDRLGRPDLAIEVLVAELESEHQWGRLAAAIVLDEMDQRAKPATAALEKAKQNQPNKYIVRVANRALNEMAETNNVVP